MSDDRTAEFFAMASELSPGNGIGNPNGTYSSLNNMSNNFNVAKGRNKDTRSSNNNSSLPPNTSSVKLAAYNELRNFHTSASEISRDITQTSSLLSELAQLVRTRTLFMDDSERVNFLVLQIKSNIENLNVRLEESQKVIYSQKRRLGEKSQAGQEASNIVGQLKEDFVKATTGFKAVLQQRSDWMKEQSERKRDVFGGNAQADNLSFMTTKPHVYASPLSDPLASKSKLQNNNNMLDLTSGLMMDVAGKEQFTGETSNSTGMRNRNSQSSLYAPININLPNDEPKTVLTPSEMKRLDEESGNAQMMQLIPDQNYLRERADAMSTVETNIVELGTIFNKLAVMVNEHREVVQRLEDNVNDANNNISLSMETLTDTLTTLRTNKALFGKVFGILVVFIILFVTFFA